MPNEIFQELLNHKIVAIVRGIAAATADDTAQALAAGGIRLLEVTMNTPGALEMIARWRQQYSELRIGAGTVLDLPMAEEAVAAGAQFLISPNLDEEVVAYGVQNDVEVWPGTMTPTEIVRAWKAGAHAVKVFPLSTLGPQYLKDIRAPLGHIPMIAVGGVDLENTAAFLRAGAIGVGIGSSLVDKSLIEAGRFEDLTALAAKYVAAVSSVNGGTAS